MSGVEQSEGPAPAGPSSASPAAPEAELPDEGPKEAELPEAELPDWSALEPEPACGVEVTRAVVETLAADLDDDAAAQSARRAEAVEVRVALCDQPAFLKVTHGEGMPQNAMLDHVRAMKARGVEHVRYRSVDTPVDIHSRAKISRMQCIAYTRMLELDLGGTWVMFLDRESSWHLAQGPGSASAAPPATPPQKCITDANERSLWVTKLKAKDPQVSGPLRERYEVLLF